MIRVGSFCLDNGIPDDATVFYDCTDVPLPPRHLRMANGRDPRVQRAVLASDIAQAILEQAEKAIADDPDCHVAFGCAWGYHRSVALAEELARRHGVTAVHFDLGV